MVVVVTGPVDSEPLVARLPLQPSLAVHEVALVALQASVDEPPEAITDGVTLSETVGGGITVTVTLCDALPPVPVQVSVYVVVVDSGAVVCVPEVAFGPVQPSVALQLVALVELHVSVAAAPLATVVGFAPRATVGAGTTVTEALWVTDPPVPVQVSVNVVSALIGAEVSVPLVALVPLQPPDAVQLVALVELQLIEAVPPFATLTGRAVSVRVGADATATVTERVTLPPVPVHASVKVVDCVSGAVIWLPFATLPPLQPPEAVQAVALVVTQVSAEVPPLCTVVGLAVKLSVGAGATVTVTVCEDVPPAPLQLRVKSVVAASGAVVCEPAIALPPLQPPVAVQLLALVELQLRVDVPPLAIVAGFATSVTVGGAGGVPAVTVTVCEDVPPGPVQLRVKFVSAVSGADASLPVAALLPLQPSDAVQPVALVLLQVSCVGLPITTEVGLAASVTVGAGGPALIVTDTVRLIEPPGPLQFSVKSLEAARPMMNSLPLSGLPPVQPPEARQARASVDCQVSVIVAPGAAEVGLALRVSVGGASETVTGTACCVVPPGPLQVRT